LLGLSPLGAQQSAQPAAAQPQQISKLTLEQYFDLEHVRDPQLSPNGKRVIYTRRWVDKLNDRVHGLRLHRRDVAGLASVRDECGRLEPPDAHRRFRPVAAGDHLGA
jgi:hypothetical protein